MDLTADHTCQDCGVKPTYRHVFEKWVSSQTGKKETEVLEFLRGLYPQENPTDEFQHSLTKYCHLLCLKFEKNWQKCNRTYNRFLRQYQDWLSSPLDLPTYVTETMEESEDAYDQNTVRGRPLKKFEDCTVKTKKRRVEHLIKTASPEELCFAAEASSSKRIFDVNDNKSLKKCLSPEEAMALSFDLDLSDRKYQILRKVVNSVHTDCFPSLYAVRNMKKSYIPESILATDVSAKVNMQDILNKTVESISGIIHLKKDTPATLVCKWGFDGSGNHREYKQIFSDSSSTDEYLFLTAFVPLKLNDVETGESIWTNKYPGSTLLCRPIEFTFTKECPEVVTEQEAKVQQEIEKLIHCKTKVGNYTLTTNFQLHFTMVDGSVCNVLSNTNSTANCFICGAKPTEMNQPCIKQPNETHYRFGLSSLHSWIRCFECLIHIAYRLPFKTWQVRKLEHKEIFKKEKERKTARRFFVNSALSSEITGIDETLIKKFGIILKLISSNRQIHKQRFQELLAETRDLYLNLYRWYYMPCSVHKLLIHGAYIIEYFSLPIGQMSEEALEATHKVFRKTRLCHTRKTSRVSTCLDLMKRMLLMSDPKIVSKRNIERRNQKKDDKDVEYYLVKSEGENIDFSEVMDDLELSSEEDSD